MIDMDIAIIDRVGPALEKFGNEKNQSRILNFILARVGRRYRAHMRSTVLGGQIINGGRGGDSLSSRILVYKNKRGKNIYTIGEKQKNDPQAGRVKLANIFEHAGGYTIQPKSKKALFFVDSGGHWAFTRKPIHGIQRPFMSASFASFGWNPAIDAEAEAVFKKEIAKEGLQ
jgi:hypothetical protein